MGHSGIIQWQYRRASTWQRSRVAETDGQGSVLKKTVQPGSEENDESGKDRMRQSPSSQVSCMCVFVRLVSRQ